jgi:hypothetical protein
MLLLTGCRRNVLSVAVIIIIINQQYPARSPKRTTPSRRTTSGGGRSQRRLVSYRTHIVMRSPPGGRSCTHCHRPTFGYRIMPNTPMHLRRRARLPRMARSVLYRNLKVGDVGRWQGGVTVTGSRESPRLWGVDPKLGEGCNHPHRGLYKSRMARAVVQAQPRYRSQRYHYLNDLIWRAMLRASIPSVKELRGSTRTKGKRPDSLIVVPWPEGRCAAWDVAVTDTVAASCVTQSFAKAASAAGARGSTERTEICRHNQSVSFFPLAFETMGSINGAGQDFISELGHQISDSTENPRETSYLFQRTSVALQRFNAIFYTNSFPPTNRSTPRYFSHICINFSAYYESSTN